MLHPPLFKSDSKGRTRTWRVETDEAGSYRTLAGLIDGKQAVSEWTRCEPKNVGRSNATTPIEQCDLEVAALYTQKRDKHYVDTVDAVADERAYFEVQLAEPWDDYHDRLDFTRPIFHQPKLDGLRGPTNRNGTHSRKGIYWSAVAFISEFLAPVFELEPDLVLDGEVYNHELHDDFNEIVSSVKRLKPTDADLAKARELAQLHVYDAFFPRLPHLTLPERMKRVDELLSRFWFSDNLVYGPVHLVQSTLCASMEELDAAYEQALEDNYEGGITRYGDEPYVHKRTKSMLKRKEWTSAEFRLKEITEGKGNWTGAAKRVEAYLGDGRTFGAGVMGKRPFLQQLLRERERYTHARIKYFKQLTPDGIPRFGRVEQFYEGERDD